MPYIPVPPDLPGIAGLLATSPDTAKPMMELAEVLLRGPSTLTSGERELIAAYVSNLNECRFCASSHGAAAAVHLGEEGESIVQAVKESVETAPVSAKLKTLLTIAGLVQSDARTVEEKHIEAARAEGATSREIHDTVLIAAAFSMYNRYVDGLRATTPTDPAVYRGMGQRLATLGYLVRK